jgi:1-acyl-sn-glycerol-3-phosphate acyltransferase
LFVITCELIRLGMSQRIVFPVRSNFFYDNPLGFLVNGMTSFFAMYPPVFRDSQRAALNLLGLDELVALLQRGGTLVGLHPEGRRNLNENPYQLLPAQSGVGRLIRLAQVPVIPVFINGLSADGLGQQLKGNFTGNGTPIHTVFGAPIDFGDLLDRPRSPHLFKQIAELTLAEISRLGEEEKELRRNAEPG